MTSLPYSRRAFTLIELMVVIVIITILVVLVFAVMQAAKREANKSACISNLRQIGIGISSYSADYDGNIPYGPKAPPFTSATNFYPSTGAPTSLISLQKGDPVALGLLLDNYLSKSPKVLFCPGSDQLLDGEKELAKVGKSQAQCSYYYRHGGNTKLFDMPGSTLETENIRLSSLGNNRKGLPVRALVIDSIFLCPDALKSFGVRPLSNHQQKFANVLYSDGHVSSHQNTDKRFTVDITNFSQVRSAFDKILTVFEKADEEPY